MGIMVITECDVCDGALSAEPETVECETDSQIADHEFVGQEYDPTTCEIDGWKKIEHDLHRNLQVHGSCFLDNDDVLVRV